MKTAEDLDRAIWKVYQSIPMHSSNPENLIKPIRDFVNQQVAAERERIREIYVNGLPTGECKAWDFIQHAKRFTELIDSL